MNALLNALLQWVSQHPDAINGVVFLFACTESLVLVGLVVPGAIAMFAAGALIAAGSLSFWPTAAAAFLGAVVGDSTSFWIGQRYGERLRQLRPLSTHPEWIVRAENLLSAHGGKGIMLGRFIGAIRPVVPAVAGMLGMPAGRFLFFNVLSALLWAPAYLLPGMAVGASLAVAQEVASRLVALAVLLLGLLVLIIWAVRAVTRRAAEPGRNLLNRIEAGLARHPTVAHWLGSDPHQPAVARLLVLAILLVVGIWGFFAILDAVLHLRPILAVDLGIYHLLRSVRTPWGDAIMVALTEIGDPAVLLPLAGAVGAWLLLTRRWRLAAYWLTTLGAGYAATVLVKLLLREPRPIPLPMATGPFAYAFPSAHASASMMLFGLLALLVARGLAPRHRWLPYSVSAVLILLVAFSRLYLGAHWFSDVIGGLCLGLIAVVLFAIASGRRAQTRRPVRGLAPIALIALALPAGLHIHADYATDHLHYAPQYPVATVPFKAWWQGGWRELPRFRLDLGGEHEQPLNLQWAGDLGAIRARLTALGWRQPVPLSLSSALRWLAPRMPLSQLPILPLFNAGRDEALVMRRATTDPNHQQVIRLWPAAIRLEPAGVPLWVGNISEQEVRNLVLLRIPSTRPTQLPLQQLADQLPTGISRLLEPPSQPPLLLVSEIGLPQPASQHKNSRTRAPAFAVR